MTGQSHPITQLPRETLYRTLFESAPIGIVLADANGCCIDANECLCQMLRRSRDQFIGQDASDLFALGIEAKLGAGHTERSLQRSDGSKLVADVVTTRLEDGTLLGMIRDITSLQQHEHEIARVSRLYATLSHINQAILWASTGEELLLKVCRVLVELGGLRMAWIDWHVRDSQRLVPVAQYGATAGYLKELSIGDDAELDTRGPSVQAFRSGQPYISNDMAADPALAPWQAARARHRVRACAALPIRMQGQVRGVLNVYSEQPDFFHDKETALLETAAADVSFALDNFTREQARRAAEQTLRAEKVFWDTMIESMPGILYLYDDQGRFLRWNRNFETVCGYRSEEIAHLHPLDFFTAADKDLLTERIAEVFATGESSVEAAFRSKDGSARPYFFTGRRLQFEGKQCLIGVGIDISDRRRAEDRLAESERKYRELVEHANSIILRWSAAGRITFLNEFGQRFFGYTAEEIIGQHVLGTLVPATESDGRDLQQLMREICADPAAFEQSVNENLRRGGERVWIAWTNRIVRVEDGKAMEILSVGTDITARLQAEARLRESEAHLIEAQRIAKIGSWALNLHDDTLRWSGQTCEIFGLNQADSVGTYADFLSFVHPADRSRLLTAQYAALASRSRLDIEHRIVLRDGNEKMVHQVADVKLDAGGVPCALSGMVRDITDRARIEAEREKRHRAEAADRIKSAFLATMSHELRTPLNSIIGFTGILLQGLAGPLNPEQNKQLDMVRVSARHLLALVNDVLDISKIEAGQLDVALTPFDVRRSLDKVLTLVTPLAQAKRLELLVRVAPELGAAVGDARRFEQIVLNLLSNAIKFTDAGAVTLAVECLAECVLPGTTEGPALRLEVSDTGIGIKPEDLQTLFQPFRQIDSGLARQHEGTGLGLAICRGLTELLGGTISAHSEWGQGSTFRVVLPLTRTVLP